MPKVTYRPNRKPPDQRRLLKEHTRPASDILGIAGLSFLLSATLTTSSRSARKHQVPKSRSSGKKNPPAPQRIDGSQTPTAQNTPFISWPPYRTCPCFSGLLDWCFLSKTSPIRFWPQRKNRKRLKPERGSGGRTASPDRFPFSSSTRPPLIQKAGTPSCR